MLPNELISTFQKLFGVESARMDHSLKVEFNRLSNEFTRRGVLASGAACHVLIDESERSLNTRAQVIFALLNRAATSHAIEYTVAAQADILQIFTSTLIEQEVHLEKLTEDTPPFRAVRRHEPAILKHIAFQLKKACDQEIIRISGELELMVAAQAKREKSKTDGGPSFNISGPVGVIQTGAGSFGVANQHIDQSAADALIKAIDVIDRALRDAPERQDAAEIIVDVRAELGKPKPNSAKLGGLLTGLGAAISYTPKLREAYDTLKWAATFFHINLP